MHIYLKNNPAKFHPHWIWNEAVSGRSPRQEQEEQKQEEQENKNKMSSDMRSVPDLRIANSHYYEIGSR